MEAYEDATSVLHGYLVIDCNPKSSRDLKLRTNIFPGEETVCYLKKRTIKIFISMKVSQLERTCFLKKDLF